MPFHGKKGDFVEIKDTVVSGGGGVWNNKPQSQLNYGGYFDIHTSNIANTNADDYFFPVVFNVGDMQPFERVWFGRYYSLTPAPPQRNVASSHYGGCVADLVCQNGGWDAGSNLAATRQVYNVYHTLCGNFGLFGNNSNAHYLYLRGGYRYYWYATSDIANSYWANDSAESAIVQADRHAPMVYGQMTGIEGDTTTGFKSKYNNNVQNAVLVKHESTITALTSRTNYSNTF
jgi:hypothetical protein